MFGLFSPATRRSPVTRSLSLESLEPRYCPATTNSSFVASPLLPVDLTAAAQSQQTNGPAGPYTVTLNYTLRANQNVELTGNVTGGSGVQLIEVEGPIDGYITTKADGSFDITTTASYLGTVLIAVLPGGSGGTSIASNVAEQTLVDAPAITNFTATQINGVAYEFTGQVTGTYVQGLTITFGGQVVSLQGQTATVNADGTFTLFINLTGGTSDTGLASAQILADTWGLESNLATTTVS